MDSFVSYRGKKLRRGYTTGSCAAGASLAAALMVKTQDLVERVRLRTPAGVSLDLDVHNQEFTKDWARCSVVKDGGDDIDVTDGLHVFSTLSLTDFSGVDIDGGQGVGRITKKGLKVPPGQAAINPVPRQMIEEAVTSILGDQGARVVISVEGGEEIAQKTFNPRLGIEGGISILGTSGIVDPMSDEGWKESISLEMEQKKAYGMDRIVLTPGGYGETFIRDHTKINPDYPVQMSNFVGYSLMEAGRLGFKEVLMVGHLGKFIKVAGGIFSTHSKDADGRNEIMIANLALMGADLETLKKIDQAVTTEGQAQIVMEAGYEEVYQILTDKIKKRSMDYIGGKFPHVNIEAISFLSDADMVRSTLPIKDLEERFK